MQGKRRALEKAAGRDGGRGGGEPEIYGPLKASFSAEHPAWALRAEAAAGPGLGPAPLGEPRYNGDKAGGAGPATSARCLSTAPFRSRRPGPPSVNEITPTSADADVWFEIVTRPEVFEVGFFGFFFP